MARRPKMFGFHPREKKRNVSKTLRNKQYYKNRAKRKKNFFKVEAERLRR